MNELILIMGMTLISFGIRYVMFLIHERIKFSGLLLLALSFTPSSVLAAIVLPAVLFPTGDKLEISIMSPYTIGFLVSLIVGIVSRNVLAVIASGMAVFLVVRVLVGSF